MTKTIKENIKECAIKICDLTRFGQPIHPNDIIPDIECLISLRDKELREAILPKVQKFIDKVESGRARSKETYQDMLEIRTLLSTHNKEN